MAMTLRSAVRKALRARLSTLAGLPTVLWEGERTTVPVGTLYCTERLRVAPDGTQPITLGPNPFQRARFRYEVDIHAPFPNVGTAIGVPTVANAVPLRVAEGWADAIAAHFPLSLALVAEGRTVLIDRTSTGEAIIDRADHASCSVAIHCYTEFQSAT